MADALKAEGNKAFSAKDYPTAMYALYPTFYILPPWTQD
jgi:hypothetical protein